MYSFLFDAAAGAEGAGGLTSMLPLLGIYAAFFVILYFVLIRPQRKQQKETAKMQNAITNGDWVLLSNGMYGKVVNIINDNLMVEFGTNRSIIIPVRRDQILAAQEPDLTQKTVEEVEKAPEDAIVGNDLAEDQLDAYDQYILEKGNKKNKNGLFGKSKN
ncbi:MAG: preprotein translocase subunit YajC [Firmicutes bacterium]|nr:preprotein translocase subunit YajC [Bacillota bacterium]